MVTAAAALTVVVLLGPGSSPPPSTEDAHAAVTTGFVETTVLSGLTNPTVVRFSPDGRVFVAEKSGLIKVFDSVNDPTPTTFADLRTNVHNFWDRGLLGMALDPNFPATPYVYVLYTYDHMLGDAAAAPKWGTAGATSDGCPSPPGPTTDGCVVSGRVSRLLANGNVMSGSEQVLVEDWCQQYPSHSVGTVEFGPDGALYASAGDGASFNFADYGQDGSPLNPCGDPPGGAGATLTPPTAEGGALRSQDLRTSGDPVSLDGSLIRVNPSTGAALPTNPLFGNTDANARRIIAHGFRNPFRFAFRPGTSEIWVGDVGWSDWEEINTIDSPTDSTVENFGWPCFEGNPRQPGYDALGLAICQNLATNAVTSPYYAYKHTDKVVPGETCPTGSSSIAGLSFEFSPAGGTFPAAYQGALFFADYSRDCIWVMTKGGNSKPTPGHLATFVSGASNPVNLEFGPEGNLYYVDFDGGTIRRIAPTTAPPAGSTFGPPTHYSTGTNAHGVALANLNGDGRLDMAVANAGSNTITVRLGNGDGTFGAPTNFVTGTTPKSVAAVDLSGDGNLDLVTADQSSSTVSVLLGTGTGSFGSKTSYPVCTSAHEAAVGSFNGDGRPDLAVACWGGSVISVLLGTGNGAFGSATSFAAGAAPHSIVTRDFNLDGQADLAVANHDGASVSVLRGNGNGTFQAPVNYTVGAGPHSIRVGDFNADGFADLVTANDGANSVSVLLGSSGGTFSAATSYPTGLVPKSVAVGDFNMDGKRDLVTANTAGNYPSGGPNPGGDQVSVLQGNGSGGFGAPTNYQTGNTPFAVVVGQLNADSSPDLVTANWFSDNASVLLNTTTGLPPSGGTTYVSDMTFTQATNGWGPVERDTSNGEAAAGDGVAIRLNGTAYTKGLGVHALSDVRMTLPANCTRFKGSVGLDDEVGSLGSVTFEVYADATKIYDSGVMNGATATNTVDVAIPAGAVQLRLNITNGGNGIAYDHADWAEARIECGAGGGDTTPPTITNRTPAPGASGVAVTVSPTATFSEAMDPATLTTSTFTLVQQGQSTPLAASVSYASQVATLDPSADLLPNTTYNATVKGGASGAKDLAGNPLAADVTWSFSTAGTNQPPVPVIDSPTSLLTWKVGDVITFSGQATDPEQGALPASALTWTLLLQHCPSNCHSHTIQSWPGVANGSFTAPDHEYPSYLELQLTATDGGGASGTTSARLDPQTVTLSFATGPTGLQLSVNGVVSTAPFTRTVINGSQNSLTAPSPQSLGGTTYVYSSWSDGGNQTHNVTASASTSYTATFTPATGGTTTYVSDMTFTQATNGWGPVERDTSNGEAAAGDGVAIRLNGTAYTKGLGVHALSDVRMTLPANCTRFKGSVGLDDEVGSLGSVTFEVYADATKIYDSGVMNGATATNTVDVAIPAGAVQLRLNITNGGNGIAYDHADWAEARIECGAGGGDTTPPTITNRTPAPGASGVAVTVSPTATFSEAMDPATLTTSTFTLVQQGQSTPLAASVSYASQVATLDPSADLLPNTTYNATVKGGASGAKDLAGNPLAADVTWSFSTAATGPTTTYLSDLTWTSMTNGWGPVEKDRSNGEAASGDGVTLTLNGTTFTKGLGTHALSDVRYALPAGCTRFKASVGLDDEVGSLGSVTFEVYADATKIYDSGLMTGATATKTVDVAIAAGAAQLRLVVTNGGDSIAYDHADWAVARIEC